jgi:hypothetical protein
LVVVVMMMMMIVMVVVKIIHTLTQELNPGL